MTSAFFFIKPHRKIRVKIEYTVLVKHRCVTKGFLLIRICHGFNRRAKLRSDAASSSMPDDMGPFVTNTRPTRPERLI